MNSSAPNSSRGSTKATGDSDSDVPALDAFGNDVSYGLYVPDDAPRFPGDTGVVGAGYPEE